MLPVGLQLGLASAIAEVAWRVLPAMHTRVRHNVRHILGFQASRDEVERIAREQWRNYVRYMRDFAALPHAAQAEIERIFGAIEGWDNIAQVMAQGKGLVLASAHIGNWDLAAGMMAQHYPVKVIADTFSSSQMDGVVNARRDALGVGVIPIEKALKRTFTALRHGEAVAFLIDKPVPGDAGVEVEFFGKPVRIPAGAAYFAKRAGAPLICAFIWRNPDGSFGGRVFPPLEVDTDPQVTMQRAISTVEQIVREHPNQWYMFRSMWPAQSGARALEAETRLEEAVA